MRGSAAVSAAVLFLALTAVGLFTAGDGRELSRSSYGVVPAGHGALYDLLVEAGVPVARSMLPPSRLPPGRTVWWIEPDAACGSEAAPDPADPLADPEPALAGGDLAEWVRAGGRAVVLLPAPAAGCGGGSTLAGWALPARQAVGDAGDDALAGGAAGLAPWVVTGPLVRDARALPIPDLVAFEGSSDAGPAGDGNEPAPWSVAARVAGRPFALSARLGEGELLVLADAAFARNAALDAGDAAPLVLDLVAAHGAPWIDEREHGLSDAPGAFAYLARSSALPFLAGGVLLAAAWLGHRGAEPPRRLADPDPAAPTLDTFVDSMAALFAATRDHPRVLERYRELTARRLARRLGLPPGASPEALAARVAPRARGAEAGLALLARGGRVRSAAELARAAHALDALVEAVDR